MPRGPKNAGAATNAATSTRSRAATRSSRPWSRPGSRSRSRRLAPRLRDPHASSTGARSRRACARWCATANCCGTAPTSTASRGISTSSPARCSRTATASAFLRPDDGSDDLYLAAREMQLLWDGDRVAARASDTTPRPRRARRRDPRARQDAHRRAVSPRARHRFRARERRVADRGADRPRRERTARSPATSSTSRCSSIRASAATPSAACSRSSAARISPASRRRSRYSRTAFRTNGRPRCSPRRARWSAEVPEKAKEGREDLRSVAARDDRRRRREGFRRRRVLRAAGRRLAAARRDRRREPLCARRLAARPRGARARDVGLLPRPRRADAARGAVERPVLAESARRSAVLGLRDAGVARAAR